MSSYDADHLEKLISTNSIIKYYTDSTRNDILHSQFLALSGQVGA